MLIKMASCSTAHCIRSIAARHGLRGRIASGFLQHSGSPFIVSACGMRHVPMPETFEHVVFPPGGPGPLPEVPKTPFFDKEAGEKEYRTTDRRVEARGPEMVHTELIHKQFGIVALDGGMMKWEHFETIRMTVNKQIKNGKNRFAIWRIEPPWLPRTKRRVGARMGGGKGPLAFYVSPVRAGRVIVELGGHITTVEAQAALASVAALMPFKAQYVTQQDMEDRKTAEERIRTENQNPYTWDFVMKWNMQNCSSFLSFYEQAWRGKTRI